MLTKLKLVFKNTKTKTMLKNKQLVIKHAHVMHSHQICTGTEEAIKPFYNSQYPQLEPYQDRN